MSNLGGSSTISEAPVTTRPRRAGHWNSLNTIINAQTNTSNSISYDHMCKFVTTDANLLAMFYTARMLTVYELDSLAESFTNVSVKLGTLFILVNELLKLEFEKAEQSKSRTLMRANSLLTKMLDFYMQNYGFDYVKKAVSSPLRDLLEDPELDLEVDKDKIDVAVTSEQLAEDPDFKNKEQIRVAKQNQKLLLDYTQRFTNAIINSLEEIPIELKTFCTMMAQLASSYHWDIAPVIGAFLMLRIINPAILFPDVKGILPSNTQLSKKQRRNLILISKILQNLSNNIEFGNKEEYMTFANAFILENQESFNRFLESTELSIDEYNEFKDKNEAKLAEAIRSGRVSHDCRDDILNIHLILANNEEKMVSYLREKYRDSYEAQEFKEFLAKLPKLSAEVVTNATLKSSKSSTSSLSSSSTNVASTSSTTSKLEPEPAKKSSNEERYLALVEKAKKTDLKDVESHRIITFSGTDKEGRPIAIFTEENIHKIDLELVVLYLVKTLDEFVNNEYVLVWCVSNSATQTRPGFPWMLSVYRTLSRKYRKNLKKFFLVHPVWIYKLLIKFFRPFVSEKFWKKLHLVDHVSQMYQLIDKNTLLLAASVLSYDVLIAKKSSSIQTPVFGSPLHMVMQRPDHAGKEIPVVVENIINFITEYGLKTEGIFRINATISEVQKLKILYDRGEHNIDLHQCFIHDLSGVLKLFFRELPTPLLPYDLYDKLLDLVRNQPKNNEQGFENSVSNYSQVENMKQMLKTLPSLSYILLKRLIQLLHKISLQSDVNMMTANNLAICFGPNILKSSNDNPLLALTDAQTVAAVIKLMINEYVKLFEMESVGMPSLSLKKELPTAPAPPTSARRHRNSAMIVNPAKAAQITERFRNMASEEHKELPPIPVPARNRAPSVKELPPIPQKALPIPNKPLPIPPTTNYLETESTTTTTSAATTSTAEETVVMSSSYKSHPLEDVVQVDHVQQDVAPVENEVEIRISSGSVEQGNVAPLSVPDLGEDQTTDATTFDTVEDVVDVEQTQVQPMQEEVVQQDESSLLSVQAPLTRTESSISVAVPISFEKLNLQEEDEMFEDDDYALPEDYDEEAIEKQIEKLQGRKISEKSKFNTSYQSTQFLSKIDALEQLFSDNVNEE